jgi:hypothetical protein
MVSPLRVGVMVSRDCVQTIIQEDRGKHADLEGKAGSENRRRGISNRRIHTGQWTRHPRDEPAIVT